MATETEGGSPVRLGGAKKLTLVDAVAQSVGFIGPVFSIALKGTTLYLGGNFQNVGNCSTGRHEITSKSPFGLWVWGWGTPETTQATTNVSYGYPGGMNVQPINQVVILPTTK